MADCGVVIRKSFRIAAASVPAFEGLDFQRNNWIEYTSHAALCM